jgi:exodeoxyribonuclease V alpha subunit
MATATKYFAPKDRTRREHVGQLDRVVWCDPDRPAVIIRLTDGASVIGPGVTEQFVRGQQYRFHGRWSDGKFGPEFKFETFTLDVPHSKVAVVKYLTETCRGVGKITAEKLFDKFGPDAVRLLREEPRTVADAGFLGLSGAEDAARDLERFAHVERTKVDLFGIFAGRGFPSRLIDRAIATWGVRAPDVIRRDPFALLVRRLPGCGFKRCDKLYLDLRHKADGSKRQAVAAWHAIREDRSGSTWLDAADVIDAVLKHIPGADPIKSLRVLIRAGWVRLRRDGDARYVAIRERADAEQRIADNIRRLSRFPSLWPALLVSSAEGDGLPSKHQAEQWRRATAGAVGFLCGGPGTGKTHTLSFGLKQLTADHGPAQAAVCAPTGKASVRAGESLRARGLDIRATTFHQLLEIGRNGHDGDGWGFVRGRDHPLDARFYIPDEASMVDAGLMADFLDAVPTGGNVLFVGDPYQLPPVGHGAPLRDLLAAGLPQGELTEFRRNSGAIVRACAEIKAGLPVTFCDQVDLTAADLQNLRLIECGQAEARGVLEDVLDQVASLGFDQVWETQIITPLNDKSDLSRVKLNERLGGLLNPAGRSAKGNPFKVGDKIICLRNMRLKTVVPIASRFGDPDMMMDAANYQAVTAAGDQRPAEWYVANGEIGRVVAVSERHTVARFGGFDVPLVLIANAKRKNTEGEDGEEAATGAAADFDHAWAITVHRSQGSEWPVVLCLIDDAGSMIADRNFWYTAISRARSLCVVIGPRGVFDRQVKRQALTRRRTFLADLLKGNGGAE